MICYTLFSGSSGNSIYVKEKNTEILIDAGQNLKKISEELKKIGSSIENISAVWVTHEHIDHTKGLLGIAKNYEIPIYCKEKVAREIYLKALNGANTSNDAKYLAKCIRTVNESNVYDSGDIQVTPFKTLHDSFDSVGYVLGDSVLGIATDLGKVTSEVSESLIPCKHVILESNYDEDMLKSGPYPPYLKERILSEKGHLSNEDCGVFSEKLLESGCESITLFHISKDNNTPEKALETTRFHLSSSGASEKDITVLCALREGAMRVF